MSKECFEKNPTRRTGYVRSISSPCISLQVLKGVSMKCSSSLFLVVCTCLVLFPCSVSAQSVPPVITIVSFMGDVTFHHADHQISSKGQCVLCHHQGAGTLKCGKCHNGVNAKRDKEVIHTLCRSCHERQAKPGVPVVCIDCHHSGK